MKIKTERSKRLNRQRRREWLANPENRLKDRIASRERYHRRKKAAAVLKALFEPEGQP